MTIKVMRRHNTVRVLEFNEEGFLDRGQRCPYTTLEEAKERTQIIRRAIKLGHDYETCRECLVQETNYIKRELEIT